MSRIRIPTFDPGPERHAVRPPGGGRHLPALRAQGTPVKMLWRSSGHSGGGISGESSRPTSRRRTRAGMALEWFDYYLRGIGDPPTLDFSFLRDWVEYEGDAAPAVGVTPSVPGGHRPDGLPLGAERARPRQGARGGRQRELRGVTGRRRAGRRRGRAARRRRPRHLRLVHQRAAGDDFDVVGIPQLTVKLSAPTFAQTRAPTPPASSSCSRSCSTSPPTARPRCRATSSRRSAWPT